MRATRTVIEISINKTGDPVEEDIQADLEDAIRRVLDLTDDEEVNIVIDDEGVDI